MLIEWMGARGYGYVYDSYTIPIEPLELPANYIFVAWQGNEWIPLYIGQTDNFAKRINNHEKLQCAFDHGMTHIHVRYSRSQRLERILEETDLIDMWNPVCNN